jgi:hypothetical protein
VNEDEVKKELRNERRFLQYFHLPQQEIFAMFGILGSVYLFPPFLAEPLAMSAELWLGNTGVRRAVPLRT